MPALFPQQSFAGGEIAPSLYGRVDQVKYATGLRTCRNFVVARHGGVFNRAGTRFICEVKDSSKRVRLIRFVFNAEQTYVLEFGDQYMRVVREGAQLESGGSPYEIATPYLEDDLSGLQFVQSGDVVTIVHPSYAPRELSRTGHTSWSLSTITFAPSISAPSGVGGTAGPSGSDDWVYVVTAVAEETYEESLPSSEVTINGGTPTESNPHEITWSAHADAVEFNIYRELNGIFSFIGIAKDTSFQDTGIVPDVSDTPPSARNPFDASDKYPATVAYFQQRLCFAASNNEPEKVWMSKPGQFKNFSISSPLQEDDAVTFRVVGRQVNQVRHLIEVGKLLILTSGGEWLARGDQSGAVTPTSPNLSQEGYSGAAEVAPIIVGNNALYVQARGTIIRDLRYELQSDGYTGRDLTVFAAHLFDGHRVVEWDFAQIPHSIAWSVRDDGTLLGLTYVREHDVWGWHRHDTHTSAGQSVVENICVVPEGQRDAVYLVVKREVDGATVRYIERMEDRDAEEPFFVDCGLTYDGRNADTGHTMTLSGGTEWTYTEDLTLTSSTAYFDAGEVGNAITLEVDGETITCTIIAYVSTTEVTVQADRDVPAAFRNVAISDWTREVDELTGLDHLEDETVSVLADGNVEPQATVSGGAITLQRPAGVVHAGLPITADLETLNLDLPDGRSLADRNKIITKVTMFVESSRGIFAGPDADHLREYKQRSTEDYGESVRLATETIDVQTTATWNRNGRVFIRQSDPLPLSVLAILPVGDIGGS